MKATCAVLVCVLMVTLQGLGGCATQPERKADVSDADANAVTGAVVDVVVDNLQVPWGIGFLPDGRMIFTERLGRVSIVKGDEKIEAANIAVAPEGEGGLLGLAVDPEFKDNQFIYLYYTRRDDERLLNRISRFRLNNDLLTNQTVLLDDIPGAVFHDGGRLKFGPDGKLYATTGDSLEPKLAQDTQSLAGKVLRINKDGTIPEDNPFGNAVWSYGHRNPEGLAWNPATGMLYETEHGPQRMDEINLIERGKNYGWPNYECNVEKAPLKNYVGPLICFDKYTLAPSGAVFGDAHTLYVAGLRGEQLHKIVFEDDYRTVASQEQLLREYGRLRTVVKHDGFLYIATSNRDGRGTVHEGDDKIIRVPLPVD